MAASSSRPQRMLAARFPNRPRAMGLDRGQLHHGPGTQRIPPLPLHAKPENDIRSCQQDSASLATQLQGASIFQNSTSGKWPPSRRSPSKGSPPRRATVPPPPRPVSVGTHSVPRSPPERRPSASQEAGHRLYVGFLPPMITKKNLLDRFSVYGEINDCSVAQPKFGASYTYGFVQFVHKYSSRAAIRALDDTRWGELSICVQPATAKSRPLTSAVQSTSSGTRNDLNADLPCTVFVKRLPLTVTVDSLKALFGQIGNVKNAWLAELQPRAEKLYGFVQFQTVEEAGRAVDQLNGTKIGLERIVVQFARTITPQPYPGVATHKAFKSELERVKTHVARVGRLESGQGTIACSGIPVPKVAKYTPAQENSIITKEVALGYLTMQIPCPPLTVEPNKGSIVPGQDLKTHEQGDSTATVLPSASVQLDSGIQSQVCTSTPTSACSSPVQMMGSRGKGRTESEPPGLITPTPSGHVGVGGDGPMTVGHLEGTEYHFERDPLLGVGERVNWSQQAAPGETESSPGWVTSEEENSVDSCPPPLEGACTEPPPLEVPQLHVSSTAPHSTAPLTPPASPHDQSDRLSPANSRGWVPSVQASPTTCVPFAMGRGKRLAAVLDKLPGMGRAQTQPVAGLTSTCTPATPENSVPVIVQDTGVEDQRWSSSDTDLPPPLTTPPEAVPLAHKERTTGSASRIRDLADTGQTCSTDGDKLQEPRTQSRMYEESANLSVPLATPTTSQEKMSSSSRGPPLLEGGSHLLRLPESCQVGSSGDEREMSKTRHGRVSDELERNIAQYERNTRRWQVETRRLKQKSAAIKEELRREEGEEQEWNLFEEVSDERLRGFDQILETQAKLVTEAERLRRRELNHEIVLMKAQQCYEDDELALIEITRELEAKEARDKLSLAKLENTALQRTATYMV